MPAQVIVVQRPRRNLFAVPRALPDWLRSLWAALFRTSLGDADPDEADPAGLQRVAAPQFPRLVLDLHGSHRCVGCELCVRVCPSRCLSLTSHGEGEGFQVDRFDLEHGACIGCGLCAEACPEEAIKMGVGLDVELSPLSARPSVTNLLLDPSAIGG